jgi:hypothetical protein
MHRESRTLTNIPLLSVLTVPNISDSLDNAGSREPGGHFVPDYLMIGKVKP